MNYNDKKINFLNYRNLEEHSKNKYKKLSRELIRPTADHRHKAKNENQMGTFNKTGQLYGDHGLKGRQRFQVYQSTI